VITRLAVVVLACALPMAASAQVQRTADYLSKMDADRDGRVSLVEYQDWLSYAFDAMDRDRDGVLSPAEQPGGRGAVLTRTDHRARLAERFRKQDRDRNGFLSARELAAPPQ
jgi:Ca2+-binding EF-hand superfamily protein